MKSFILKLQKKIVVAVICFFILLTLYAVIIKLFFKNHVDALIEKSRFHIASSNPAKALEILNIAITLESSEITKSKIYMWRGISYSYLMEYEKAREDFFKALTIKDADKPFIYCRLAIIYHKADSIAEFIKYFEMFKEEIPDLIIPMFPDYESINDLYLLAADYYAIKGEYDKAAIVYSNMIQMNPFKEIFFLERGDCYFKSDQIEKARADISTWFKMTPPEERSLANLSQANIIMGKYDEALKDVDRLLKIDNESASALFLRGKIRFLQGKNRLAHEDLTNFLEKSEHENTNSKQALKIIKQIENKHP